MNIVTSYVRPPVPTAAYDWMAYVDDGEGGRGITGRGATEIEALRDLASQLALAWYEATEAA